MDRKMKLLERIKTYLCTQVAAENSKHTDELRKHQQLVDADVYGQDYLEKDLLEESGRHKTVLAGCQQKAADTLNELYQLIITTKPDILGRDFQYAQTMAQTLGDSMTYEQAKMAIEPLRGQITALDVLRQSYERLGAPVDAFSEFTFYTPAKDVVPEQTTETVFDRAKTFILNGSFVDACWYLKQIADTLLGSGVMDFPMQLSNSGSEQTAIGIL